MLVTPGPRVIINDTRAAFIGPGLNLAPHKNAVATVAISLERPFRLDFLDDPAAPSQLTDFAVIPPNTLHHLVAGGAMMFLYLDPLSDDDASLCEGAAGRQNGELVETIREALIACANDQHVAGLMPLLCDALGVPARVPSKGSVAAVIRAIDQRPQDFTKVTEAAEMADLSASRFQHVFKDATGVPFRRYRLWKRMALVGRALSRGDSMTTAALDAGFASSAHLSAAFKRMFGISPSGLLAVGATINVESS